MEQIVNTMIFEIPELLRHLTDPSGIK